MEDLSVAFEVNFLGFFIFKTFLLIFPFSRRFYGLFLKSTVDLNRNTLKEL